MEGKTGETSTDWKVIEVSSSVEEVRLIHVGVGELFGEEGKRRPRMWEGEGFGGREVKVGHKRMCVWASAERGLLQDGQSSVSILIIS